jgi:ferredoxin
MNATAEQPSAPTTAATHLVTILPVGEVIEVSADESVMRAAQRAGLFWPNTCDGDVDCGACWSEIGDGAEHCSPIRSIERNVLDAGSKRDRPDVRLGCCLHVTGPVTVTKRSAKRIES